MKIKLVVLLFQDLFTGRQNRLINAKMLGHSFIKQRFSHWFSNYILQHGHFVNRTHNILGIQTFKLGNHRPKCVAIFRTQSFSAKKVRSRFWFCLKIVLDFRSQGQGSMIDSVSLGNGQRKGFFRKNYKSRRHQKEAAASTGALNFWKFWACSVKFIFITKNGGVLQ